MTDGKIKYVIVAIVLFFLNYNMFHPPMTALEFNGSVVVPISTGALEALERGAAMMRRAIAAVVVTAARAGATEADVQAATRTQEFL